jgi:hypothetical protein
MDLNKLKISDLVAEQLPDFVVNEFPTFVKFFEEYYRSLEIVGGISDITENFLEYKNLEELRKFDLVKTYELQQDISTSATSIVLDKLDGLPSENGIIMIDDEIIFYRSVNLTSKTLLECERGFSGIVEYSSSKTVPTSTVADSHLASSKVNNLSNLIKFLILRNYENQYLDGFPHENISDQISRDTLIRNVKDFYSYKGTDLSIEFLFRALFDEEVTVRYPKDYVIKSSFSDWTVDDVIKVEEIDGDPYDLVGNELNQTDASGQDVKVAVIDQILVNNIQNYPSGDKNVYEIRLNVTNNQYFTIPSNTIVRGVLSNTSSVVTVDSTIGFPELNGIIKIDDEFITYRFKTFNQFIDCGRGTYNTVAVSHADLQPVITTETLFGYKDGDRIDSNKIRLRLLGSLSTTSIVDGSNYYNENEIITLSLDGTVDDREQFNSWRKNEIGSFGSSSDVQINNAVGKITSGVTSVYKDKNFVYIASPGLPTHPIGSFRGVGFDVKNQNLLKSIPLVPEKNTQEQFTKDTPVGLFVNGVEAFSAQDYEDVPFGDITEVSVSSTGFGFETDVQPVFRVVDGTGSNATFHANIIDGKVISVDVVNGGSGYTSDRVFEVTYGFDATASVLNDGDLAFGQIKNISVTNPGVNYVVAPRVEITDISGKGNGAFATAQINNNEVVGITVLNGGVDYTDKSTIRIRIISKASGVKAISIVRKWSFDRVFKTTHDKDNAGIWAVAQSIKSDSGNGYLYASRNIEYNLQYGYPSNPKILRHTLSDNVQGVNANYDEKTSGFVHSPILGWAYDGNPIYGPYGYSQALNESSGISRQTSSYALNTTSLATRPSTSVYPLGAFVQDYNFAQGNGSLDRNNGRFCKTPEYPNGRYCYFITVDNDGAGKYPYILGTTYQSVPSQYNFNIEFNQSNQNNLPADARRIRSANTPSQGFDASLLVGEVQRGELSSFTVNSSGDSFKNLDFVFIDNTDTEGSRSFGRVEKIEGKPVSTLSYGVSSGFSASGFTTTNNIPDLPWPIDISGPEYVEQGLTFDVNVETTEPHLLSNGDQVTLNLDRQSLVSEKTYKVRVSNYQTVHYTPPVANSFLVADVSFNQTTVNVDSSIDYRENDFIMINDEILKITGINYSSHQFTVERSQFNTPIRLHAATNVVSLHIPENDKDYRLDVGSAISTPGVAGVIYSIDKLNTSIEVRVSSGSLSDTSVILDSSTPAGREISINSVGPVTTYWEIDPTNTGNYYVRDLQFRVSRGTEYILDTSDGSNFGFNLSLSEDSTNINPISNIDYLGTPGTAGARLIIRKAALLDFGVTRIYYYEQNKKISNDKKFFTVLSTPEGVQNITVVSDNVFKYTVTRQPEQLQYVNVISYDTLSKSALGQIKKISVVDGGEGYKKLPKILGIVHSQLDNASFAQSITGGGFESISVISQGSRYSNNVTLHINTLNGTGAVLTPSIVGGRIVSVSIDAIGNDYDASDTVTVIDNDAEIFAESTNIGKVKSVRFNNNGSQFTADYTLAKSLVFNKKVIAVDVSSTSYKLAETVKTPNFEGFIGKIQELGKNVLLLDIQVRSGELNVNDILTGSIQSTTSKVYSIDEPDVFGNVDGFMTRVGFFDSDLGKISSSSQKITDSYYYQDFSYVIRSTKGLSDYKKYVDETTHPLGFKLFGEVSVENDVDFEDTVTGSAFSIGLAANPHANEILIQLPTINVESDIVFKKYELSTIKAANLKSYLGTGAAQLNFLDNQIESVQIADLSSNLNENTNTYSVITNDGTFPTDTKNTSVILALNEVFQEPIDTGSIVSLSYDAGLATVTTSTDHNLAITIAGQRYPDNKYLHVSGITNSVQNINFNDKFEIYDVPSSDSFRVKISNPNGTLTNNDPAVCADVQSTIGTLIGILTYYLNNPSVALPVSNKGIWLDPAQSTVVSANRHRDGADLIYINKQEIIDRANAQISIEYPDFFYPNDPQTTSTSRYKDAYRYIQRNRKEIIDRGAAQIAIDYPDFVYPLDPATASDYRFKDAYRLIQQNRTEIVNNSWNAIIAQYPSHGAYETKCKRDMGLFIDYTSLDLVNGGNEYARKFALQFFDDSGNPITNGILGEEAEAIFGFNAAKDNMILAFTNQLTVTDTTITPDPLGAPLCANVTSAITVLAGIVNDAFTAGSIAGLPAETIGSDTTGEGKCKRDLGLFIDAVSLDVHTGGNVYARKFLKKYFNVNGNTLITNGLSGEILQSITAFNKARDMMKSAITNQLLDKDLTVTPGNAEYWGTAVGTPTAATYDAATGVLNVTVANHGLANSDNILLKENSFIFTCGMDGNVAEKSYPRVTDNAFNTNMAVSNVTTDTFQVNIGTSPLVGFDITAADYDPQSGDVELTIGTHTLSKYETIKLRDESITFTCDLDNNQTNHSYPKTSILSETIESADYDPVSGVMVITINNHGWEDGDFIKFDNNSITFTCALDNNQTNHSYPRAGSDPYAEKWLPITETTEDTFKVRIGVSSDTSAHTFVSASVNGLKKKKDKTYDTPVPITSTTATTITINVGSSTDTSVHTYVPRLYTVTDATYDAATGILGITSANHGFTAGDGIIIGDGSLTFSCLMDGNTSNKTYPRSTDPASNKRLNVISATNDQLTVNIGASPLVSFTPTGADYNPTTGLMELTIGNHNLTAGTSIKLLPDSLVFTCDEDSNGTNHAYPRLTDPFYDTAINIESVTATTITIQVLTTIPSTNTTTHTFVSATTGAVVSGGNYTHTFVSATASALNQVVVTSGGNYSHTFVRAATDAVVLPAVTSVIANNDPTACADVRSNIHNLSETITFYLTQGSLLFPTPFPNELVGIPSSGEAVCRRDLGLVVDAIINDMKTGGNSNIREVVGRYLQGNSLLPDGLAGEVSESITAFNKARDMMKLAIANQLYEKDFTILPDFLTTSGIIDSSDVTGSIYTKGQFNYTNSTLNLFEAPKFGTTFHSIFFKFVNSSDDIRYSYKVRDILFDGTSKTFDLKKTNGSNIITEADENILVFIDGVVQIYGESYTINRSVNPNKIVFTEVHSPERQFFAYTFSKYKVLNNFSHEFNSSKKSFEFKFGDDIILPPDDHQILVLLDGIPQLEGSSFTIVDNVITFTEAPTVGKNCHCLYFYGKTFDKTISIWNGNVFEKLEYLGDNNPEGCRYFNKLSNTGDIIFPGDLIKIDGETTKKIIKIDERALENTDNLLYTAFVYTDNSYVRGKNAVANAVVSGIPISGGNTVGIQNTAGIQGTQGIPPVFDYQVTGVNITNQGLEYDVAPIVLFKVECGNPGTGAEAYAEITNGRVTNIVITNPGSGYTEAPELIFAKKYEIIRPQTPLFAKRELIVDSTSYNAINGFGVASVREEEFLLPIIISQLIISNTIHVETESRTLKDTSDAGLAYNLQTFDNNKFSYEPQELNDPLASYLGTGVTIEMINRYAPALTVGDFTTHRGVSQGSIEPSMINIGPEAYVSYGLTLNGAINDTVTTITVTGNVSNFPPTGYLEFGDETVEYTSISGQDFTVVRGSKSTTATSHTDTDYLRLAWRG